MFSLVRTPRRSPQQEHSYLQVLQADRLIFTNQPGGQLVQEVLPGMADFFMQACQFGEFDLIASDLNVSVYVFACIGLHGVFLMV
jgi:hypothetical protein